MPHSCNKIISKQYYIAIYYIIIIMKNFIEKNSSFENIIKAAVFLAKDNKNIAIKHRKICNISICYL